MESSVYKHREEFPQLNISLKDFHYYFQHVHKSFHKFFVKAEREKKELGPDWKGVEKVLGENFEYIFDKSGRDYSGFFLVQGSSHGVVVISTSLWPDVQEKVKSRMVSHNWPQKIYPAMLQENTLCVDMRGCSVLEVFYFISHCNRFSSIDNNGGILDYDLKIRWEGPMKKFVLESSNCGNFHTLFVTKQGEIYYPKSSRNDEYLAEKFQKITAEGGLTPVAFLTEERLEKSPLLFIGSPSSYLRYLEKDNTNRYYGNSVIQSFLQNSELIIQKTRHNLEYLLPIRENEYIFVDAYGSQTKGIKYTECLELMKKEKPTEDGKYYNILENCVYVNTKVLIQKMREYVFSTLFTEPEKPQNELLIVSRVGMEISNDMSEFFFNGEQEAEEGSVYEEVLNDPAILFSVAMMPGKHDENRLVAVLKKMILAPLKEKLKETCSVTSQELAQKLDKALFTFLGNLQKGGNINEMARAIKSYLCISDDWEVHRDSEQFQSFATQWSRFNKNLESPFDIENDHDVKRLKWIIRRWFANIDSQWKEYGQVDNILFRKKYWDWDIDSSDLDPLMEGLKKRAERIHDIAYEHFPYTAPNGKTYPFEYMYYLDPEVIFDMLRTQVPEAFDTHMETQERHNNTIQHDSNADIVFQYLPEKKAKVVYLNEQKREFEEAVLEIWNNSNLTLEEKSQSIHDLANTTIGMVTEKMSWNTGMDESAELLEFCQELSTVLGDDVILVL